MYYCNCRGYSRSNRRRVVCLFESGTYCVIDGIYIVNFIIPEVIGAKVVITNVRMNHSLESINTNNVSQRVRNNSGVQLKRNTAAIN